MPVDPTIQSHLMAIHDRLQALLAVQDYPTLFDTLGSLNTVGLNWAQAHLTAEQLQAYALWNAQSVYREVQQLRQNGELNFDAPAPPYITTLFGAKTLGEMLTVLDSSLSQTIIQGLTDDAGPTPNNVSPH